MAIPVGSSAHRLAGKSTLAIALERRLFDAGRKIYVLDGDIVRGG